MTDVVTVEILDADDLRDSFSRRVALLIAVATLVAAFVAYQHAAATTQSSRAAATAHALAVDVLGATLRAEQAVALELDRLQAQNQQQVTAANLLQQWAAATEEAAAAELDARLRVSEALTDEVSESTAIAARDDTPEQDPLFPARLVARHSHGVFEGEAMQDAAIDESSDAGTRAAALAGVLAILAVSVYLMGLSLTIRQTTARRALAIIGGFLVVVASGWAVAAALTAPSSADADRAREAARAYADGQVAFHTAVDRDDYDEAVSHFTRAVELRPHFAAGHDALAAAAFAAGSPQHSAFLSISTPEAVELSTRHLRQAINEGSRNDLNVNNLGWHTLLAGLQSDDADVVRQSLELFDEAISLGVADPIPRYNRALALTALGRLPEARDAYSDAVMASAYDDEPLSALTDLEILAHYRPDLARQVQEMKDLVVGAYWGVNPSPDPTAVVWAHVDAAHLFPAEVQAVIDHQALVPADYVAIVWYFNDLAQSGWHVLPEVSGLVPVLDGEGTHSELTSLLSNSVPARCLEQGDYRAEIYLNGEIVDRIDDSATFTAAVPTTFGEMSVAACRPPDWDRADSVLGGALDGYGSDAGDRGLYVMTLQAPGRGLGAEGNAAAVDGFVEAFGPDLLPVLPDAPGERLDNPYFLQPDDAAVLDYWYDGGQLRAGAAIRDDVLVIGLVFGPTSWWQTDEPYDTFDSFVAYDY